MPTIPIAGRSVELSLSGAPLLIAGPCVLEDRELILRTAERLRDLAAEREIPFVFKSSFDKANRSSIDSYRGPGLEKGLEQLAAVKERLGCALLTDIHEPEQAAPAAEVVDILQIPAFLCRQTDLLVAAARTGKPVNIKKGQFLAPSDMRHPVKKVQATNPECPVLLTERGTFFGYGRLVVDFGGFRTLRDLDVPLIFDATHSVQQPGGLGHRTGGDRTLVPELARAACAVGVHGLFFEVHENPDQAPSDGPNMVRLDDFPGILDEMRKVREARGER